MNPLALYIHFPYCLYKCHYCDFNSYAVEFSEDLETSYCKALVEEMEKSFQSIPPSQIGSLFFGGGTPSLFSGKSFEKILDSLTSLAGVRAGCEVTIEMNPKTITLEKIRDYLKAGVNRFSLGVQSFEDRYLSPLGRLHSGQEAKEALLLIRKAGAENFNLDLMFGFPSQTPEEVLEDLREALQFEPAHLSFYNLTLEDGTLLKDQHQKGKIRLPDNEIQARMYEEGVDYLESRGYHGYEISNFSKAGKESRHNLSYWRYEDYLGLGAGAVGFLRKETLREENKAANRQLRTDNSLYGYRWTNPKTPKEYMFYTSNKSYPPPVIEKIDFKTASGEFWMMGLRLSDGVCLKEFERRFGPELRTHYEKAVIPYFEAKGWLSRKEENIHLTPSGRMFANEVVSGFLLD
jgi:oxygen-independent coproporphyrinogen-3 oxidase